MFDLDYSPWVTLTLPNQAAPGNVLQKQRDVETNHFRQIDAKITAEQRIEEW